MSDDGYGDEDFEAYEDEFEFDDEEEAAKPAAAGPTSPSPLPLRNSSAGKPGAGYNRDNKLVLPQTSNLTDDQRKQGLRKIAKAKEKMKSVQLTEYAFDEMFTMASLSKYQLYKMARSVYSNKKVASCQTRDDAKHEEQQTDEVPQRHYSTQAPDDRNVIIEGERTVEPGSNAGVASTASPSQQQEPGIEKLNAFMQWAGPVMLAALGLSPGGKKIAITTKPSPNHGTSGGSVRLELPALLAGRPVSCCSFAPGREPRLLVAYSPVGAQLGAAALLQDHSLSAKGLLCVWELWSPNKPAQVLLSEGHPRCCCWAPNAANNIVFSGMEEGNVCAWDLDELDSRHCWELVGGLRTTTRRPSYTTEQQADPNTMAAPLLAIAAVAKQTSDKGSSRSSPCQVVTLSAWGEVTVSSVVLLSSWDMAAGEVDLGLRLGSRVRLVRTCSGLPLGMRAVASWMKTQGQLEAEQLLASYSLAVLPSEACQFLVGSDDGRVLRGCWLGPPPSPREFICDDHKSLVDKHMPSQVSCLAVSPFLPNVFLAGHSTGSITLHTNNQSAPVAMWPELARGSIITLCWSPVRACAFFALDSACTLHCFDLLKNKKTPLRSDNYMKNTTVKGKQVASFPTWLEVSRAKEGVHPSYVMAYDDGHVEVNVFSTDYAAARKGEAEALKKIIASCQGVML